MALKSVIAWRGRLRGHLKEGVEELGAILTYNAKHPNDKLLATADVANINTVIVLLDTLIAAKRMR